MNSFQEQLYGRKRQFSTNRHNDCLKKQQSLYLWPFLCEVSSIPILTGLSNGLRRPDSSLSTRVITGPTVSQLIRRYSATVFLERCRHSHTVVSSKLLVKRLSCRAYGTRCTRTPCSRQAILGASASMNTFMLFPTSSPHHRRFPRPGRTAGTSSRRSGTAASRAWSHVPARPSAHLPPLS